MKLMLFEWKKIWKNKFFVIGIIIIYVINIAFIFLPFMKDHANNAAYNEQNKYYIHEISGTLDAHTFDKVNELKRSVEDLEHRAMLNQLETILQEDLTYHAEVTSMKEKVKENIEYFEQQGNLKQLAIQKRLLQTYEPMKISNVQYHKGWDVLFKSQISSVLIVLIIAIVVPFLWVNEYDSEMLPLLYSTMNGKRSIEKSKFMFTIALTAGITLLFSLTDLILTLSLYGFDGALAPIYMNETYRYATMSVTMLGFYLNQLLFKIVAVVVISVGILLFTKKLSNKAVAMMFSLSSLGGLLLLGEAGFRTWNPISLLYLYQSVNEYQFTVFFGKAFYSYEITLMLDAVLSIILIARFMMVHRRRHI